MASLFEELGLAPTPTRSAMPTGKLVCSPTAPTPAYASKLVEKGVTASQGAARKCCKPPPKADPVFADKLEGTPSQAAGLSWPGSFSETVKGERLEFSEAGAVATRQSGMGRGVCFLGPLRADQGKAFFEVEVSELETSRLQTMAIGICTSIPDAKGPRGLTVERAKDLGLGSYVIGYDLPKLYVHGAEVAKIDAKEWRPLKEMVVGDRLGLLIDRSSGELTVFINGERKTSVVLPKSERLPAEMWGVIDVHGAVKSLRLRKPGDVSQHEVANARSETEHRLVRQLTLDFNDSADGISSASIPEKASRRNNGSGKEVEDQKENKSNLQDAEGGSAPKPSRRRSSGSVGCPTSSKRQRLSSHPCGCKVHLISSNGSVVHVNKEDFVIGRNGKNANFVLDSSKVPNMVSRVHARILTTDDALEIVDCNSVNGTWVNDDRVMRSTLRQGDDILIGNPGQCPKEFYFRVSIPATGMKNVRSQ